eukprot:COSAG01_NODE_3885_length_5566_cov_10.185529_6_plen_436_part_01
MMDGRGGGPGREPSRAVYTAGPCLRWPRTPPQPTAEGGGAGLPGVLPSTATKEVLLQPAGGGKACGEGRAGRTERKTVVDIGRGLRAEFDYARARLGPHAMRAGRRGAVQMKRAVQRCPVCTLPMPCQTHCPSTTSSSNTVATRNDNRGVVPSRALPAPRRAYSAAAVTASERTAAVQRRRNALRGRRPRRPPPPSPSATRGVASGNDDDGGGGGGSGSETEDSETQDSEGPEDGASTDAGAEDTPPTPGAAATATAASLGARLEAWKQQQRLRDGSAGAGRRGGGMATPAEGVAVGARIPERTLPRAADAPPEEAEVTSAGGDEAWRSRAAAAIATRRRDRNRAAAAAAAAAKEEERVAGGRAQRQLVPQATHSAPVSQRRSRSSLEMAADVLAQARRSTEHGGADAGGAGGAAEALPPSQATAAAAAVAAAAGG